MTICPSRLRSLLLLLVLALPVASLTRPPRAEACAVASAEPVTIAGEEALIVWDPQNRTEHFVRTAAFEGASAHFGFMVPTPTHPEFHEAPTEVFQRVFEIYRHRPMSNVRGVAPAQVAASAGSPVQLLETRQVAGLEASVLAASDASALNGWLQSHGYPASPELEAYFRPYVRRRWLMNAFRIDPQADNAGQVFGTRAVTMSFQTRVPYFPYAEPQSTARERRVGRPFRVSVLAPYRVKAFVGGRRYGGSVAFARELTESTLTMLLADTGIRRATLPRTLWLTVFDEPASVRGEHNLTFHRDPRQTQVEPTLTARIALRPSGQRPPPIRPTRPR